MMRSLGLTLRATARPNPEQARMRWLRDSYAVDVSVVIVNYNSRVML